MKTIKNYTKGLLSFALLFFISNATFAGSTPTDGAVSNTNMFYIFLVLALVILVAIFFLSNAIKNLLSSDFYKEKVFEQEKERRDKNNNTTLLTLLLLLGLPFASFSLSPAPSQVIGAESDMSLEWVWAIVIANVILVGVLFYLRGLFLELLYSVKPKPVKVKINEAIKVNEPSKLAKLLTDVVPLDREHEIMTDHEYDGIHELDNNLPPWWLWSFYASIVFAFIYILNYHVFKTSELQIDEYNTELAQAALDIEAYKKTQKLNIDETNVVLLTDNADLEKGKKIFLNNCTACHGPKGEGTIGPNLTDDYWIHGGDIKDVFSTIKYGVEGTSMQSWKKQLGVVELQQIASYIKSLKGTVEGGKEPQGDLYKEEVSVSNAETTDSTLIVKDSL